MHTDGAHAARLGQRPALDGLRGLAIVLVLLYHAFGDYAGFAGGWLGVNLFLILSGFLITRLLMEERERTGSIRRREFYRRRIARLLPAFVVMVGTVVVVTRFSGIFGSAHAVRIGALGSVMYVANWVAIVLRFGSLGPFPHLWSLSLEEQFYLVWPVVLMLMLGRMPARRAGRVAAGIAVIIFVQLALRSFMSPNETALYVGTDGQGMAFLLSGCAIALTFPVGPEFLATTFGRWVQRRGVWAAAPIVPFVVLFDYNGNLFYYRGVLAVLAMCMGVLLLTALVDCPFSRWLRTAPMTWLGRRSYGIYLWHVPLYLATSWCNVRFDLHLALPVEFVLVLPVILLVAEASYRYVEAPLRSRLTRPTARPQPEDQVIASMRSSATRAPSAVSGSTTI